MFEGAELCCLVVRRCVDIDEEGKRSYVGATVGGVVDVLTTFLLTVNIGSGIGKSVFLEFFC